MKSIHIVMPCYNEGEGIQGFIDEIFEEMKDTNFRVTVIDDYSQDQTSDILKLLKEKHDNFDFFTNIENLGHGKSTALAMRKGIESNSEIVCTVDGDGQFRGKDIASLIRESYSGDFDIIEGCRVERNEPLFRGVVTKSVKFLVYLSSGDSPTDANTPLRVYKREKLINLVDMLPEGTMIPNLFISRFSRQQKLRIKELNVISLPRRGHETVGTTWNQKHKLLPSKRFIKFCRSAILEWTKFSNRKFKD
jgi:dolichol-phosphate mannosyltransferase